MKKILATLLAAIACFILIICLLFTTIQLVMHDTAFFESQFTELKLDESMGLTLSSLSAAITRLTDYMEGDAPDISLIVTQNGEQVEMFELEIEITHMAEVREVWQQCVSFRNILLVAALGLLFVAFLIYHERGESVFVNGLIFSLLMFGVCVIIIGTWIAIDFSSMWTTFHHIIFPGSNNWLLPASSRMIQMLPSKLFSAFITRCGIYAIAVLAPVLILSVTFRAIARQRIRKAEKAKRQEEEVERVKEIPDAVEDGPDLLAVHKLTNLPVSKRAEVAEEIQRTRMIREDVETFGNDDMPIIREDTSYIKKDGRFESSSSSDLEDDDNDDYDD